MASDSIASWQIDGEKVETVADFIFLGSQITTDNNCSHEVKRLLFLGRKAMTNLDSVLKNRDITLLTKVHIVKAMFFPVVMNGWESWTIKKAENQRIDAFGAGEDSWESLGLQRDQTKGDQSWIVVGRTDAEAEAPIFWPPDAKNWLIGKDPDAGKDWRREEKGSSRGWDA